MEIKDFESMNKKMEELGIDTPHGLSHYLRSIPGIAFLALIDTAMCQDKRCNGYDGYVWNG